LPNPQAVEPGSSHFTSQNHRNKQVPGLLCISCPDISIPPRPPTKPQAVTAALRSLLVVEWGK